MTILGYLALFGWVPAVLFIFMVLPQRVAAAIAVVGAWLMLPPFSLIIAGLPDYSKNTAATLGLLLATFLFSSDRLLTFRPRWFDLPMFLYCLCGIPSALLNGLGLYDGLSTVLNYTVMWGMPYLFGRLYFGSPQGLRTFAYAMVVGGLACVPFCLYEMRMSPMLRANIYGGQVGTVLIGTRLGGYRPLLFFSTGLELGLWMTAALLFGLVALALRRDQDDGIGVLRCRALADPAGHNTFLPVDRGACAISRWRSVALVIRPVSDAAVSAWPLNRGTCLRRGAHDQSVVRSTSRGRGRKPGGPGSGSVARVSLYVRKPADREGPPAAGLGVERLESQRGLVRPGQEGEARSDRRALDRRPRVRRVRWAGPALPVDDVAGSLVRLANSGTPLDTARCGGRVPRGGVPRPLHD